MKQTIKLRMMGTKHREFSEELCVNIMSRMVILGRQEKQSFCSPPNMCALSICFFGKDEHTTRNENIYELSLIYRMEGASITFLIGLRNSCHQS